MLDGVVVDDVTGHFLRIATDRGRGLELSQTLRVFFHDARNRLNALKIGLYLARRGAAPSQGAVWEELDQSYRGLEQLIDRMQTICRPAELARSRATSGTGSRSAEPSGRPDSPRGGVPSTGRRRRARPSGGSTRCG